MKTILKKRKTLGEKTQTDGRTLDAVPHNLADIWGQGTNKYGTTDVETYREILAKKNKAELQLLCTRYGIMPHDSRATTTERLMQNFKQFAATIRTSNVKAAKAPEYTDEANKVRIWLNEVGGQRKV